MSNIDIEYSENVSRCPVCGAPGGNCKGDSEYSGGIVFEPPRRSRDPRATFIVPERVYEETQVGSRTVKKLLYAKGERITMFEAKRLNLIPDDAPLRPRLQ